MRRARAPCLRRAELLVLGARALCLSLAPSAARLGACMLICLAAGGRDRSCARPCQALQADFTVPACAGRARRLCASRCGRRRVSSSLLANTKLQESKQAALRGRVSRHCMRRRHRALLQSGQLDRWGPLQRLRARTGARRAPSCHAGTGTSGTPQPGSLCGSPSTRRPHTAAEAAARLAGPRWPRTPASSQPPRLPRLTSWR